MSTFYRRPRGHRRPPGRPAGPLPSECGRRVLLLTSGLGSGHARAACAVEAAIEARGEGHEVIPLDLWSLLNADVVGLIHAAYLHLVQDRPELYESLYGLDAGGWQGLIDRPDDLPEPVRALLLRLSRRMSRMADSTISRFRSDRWLVYLLAGMFAGANEGFPVNGARARLALLRWTWARLERRLDAHIEAFDPHVIVSTQLIPAALVSSLKLRRGYRTPSFGVLTDFGAHAFWSRPGTDRFCIPHPSLASQLDGGTRRVSTTGIPLMPGFLFPPTREAARRQLGIAHAQPTVLVLGGGLGLDVDRIARRVLTSLPRVHVVVMVGSSARARAALAPLAAHHAGRLDVHGWTEEMEVFFRAADVVVGKPGGITVAETLACGRPLLATVCLNGQETFNVRFLEQHEVGGRVDDHGLARRIMDLFERPALLASMQARAARLGRPDAAQRIAELVLDAAHVPRSEHRAAAT